jgi:hypothetical protein
VNGTGMDLSMKGVSRGCGGTGGMDLHGYVSQEKIWGRELSLIPRRHLLFEISRIDLIKWRIAEVKHR